MFADETTTLEASAPSVAVKTVVGAGDAMMAMIVHGYINRWPFSKIAKWGVAAGSASVMKDGTAVAEFELIKALVEKVNLREIS